MALSLRQAAGQEDRTRVVTVDAYWQLIDKASEDIQELDGADDDEIGIALGALAAEFEEIDSVELADGSQIPLDNSFLIALLDEPSPDLVQIDTHLEAIRSSRERWPAAIHGTQDLLPLAEILSRPEFQSLEEEPNFLQRIWQRLVEALRRFMLRLFPGSGGSLNPIFRIILTVGGSLALIGILYFTLRGFLADLVPDADSAASSNGDLILISADQALEQAHTFSRSGDYRSAVRYLYLSSLLLLEERDLFRYDRTQTNQEYLRSLAGKPELAVVLEDVIDVFDRVWYGYQSLDERSFMHYAGRVEELRQQR